MSGGLSHHNDEENGPSHAVGYKSSKKQDSYSLERNQCVCAVEEVCPDLQKPEPKSLDRTGVVRDVEKSNLWLSVLVCEGKLPCSRMFRSIPVSCHAPLPPTANIVS